MDWLWILSIPFHGYSWTWHIKTTKIIDAGLSETWYLDSGIQQYARLVKKIQGKRRKYVATATLTTLGVVRSLSTVPLHELGIECIIESDENKSGRAMEALRN